MGRNSQYRCCWWLQREDVVRSGIYHRTRYALPRDCHSFRGKSPRTITYGVPNELLRGAFSRPSAMTIALCSVRSRLYDYFRWVFNENNAEPDVARTVIEAVIAQELGLTWTNYPVAIYPKSCLTRRFCTVRRDRTFTVYQNVRSNICSLGKTLSEL